MKIRTKANFRAIKENFSLTRKIIPVVVVFLFFVSGFGESAKAQDLLILKSGKELKVNIIEESTDIIKYRDFDNPTGPLNSIGKDKVASVSYKKGTKDALNTRTKEPEKAKQTEVGNASQSSDNKLLTVKKRYVLMDGAVQSAHKVKTLMEDMPEALNNYDKGKKLCNASNGCAFGVILTSFIATEISNGKKENSDKLRASVIGLGIDGGLIIAGIVLAVTGKHKIRNSVALYNSTISKPATYKLNIGVQGKRDQPCIKVLRRIIAARLEISFLHKRTSIILSLHKDRSI